MRPARRCTTPAAKATPCARSWRRGIAADRLRATRAFRDAITSARKTLYYHLRRYHQPEIDTTALLARLADADPDERTAILRAVAATHVSARERLPTLDAFVAVCGRAAPAPKLVLDVGCGLQPLLAPLDTAFRAVTRYVAVDRDGTAIAAVEAYARARADGRLQPVQWALEHGWRALAERTGVARYDLALILKVAPVIARQAPALLAVLAQTPADRWVVSGSAVAMTRRESIARRERAALRRFIAMAGRSVQYETTVGDEIVLIA
ncbi:MAG: hypothetical protein NZ518_08495 [Dehalococcoidia bacterium]|nr:hypothetical protein [Dehalococcoidia bacterium]